MRTGKFKFELRLDLFRSQDQYELLQGSEWEWRFYESESPFQGFSSVWNSNSTERPRIAYAKWLREVARGGVYIWLVFHPPGANVRENYYRFLHVGKADGDMRKRIQDHCRNQFRPMSKGGEPCRMDRIYGPLRATADGFGDLGSALWDGGAGGENAPGFESDVQRRRMAAEEFLRHARIVVISPATDSCEAVRKIRELESIIGSAAWKLLARWPGDIQTTNTQNAGMNEACKDGADVEVARNINAQIVAMLPEVARSSIVGAS